VRVWVTRDEAPGGPLCAALTAAGLEPVLEPVVARTIVDDCRAILETLGADDWLVLTSIFAIDAVAEEPARVPHVAVVGEQTRAAAEARGFRVGLVSTGGDRASLLADLRHRARGGKLCYPRSSLAPAPQAWPGIRLVSPILYETRPRRFDRSVADCVEVLSVVSPSAVWAVVPTKLPAASIGPTTSQVLRSLGIEPWVEAPKRSFESLAAAIAERGNR